MPNEGGVSIDQVKRIVDSAVSDVKKKLKDSISDVEEKLEDSISEINKELDKMEGKIMALASNLENLIDKLDRKMGAFTNAIREGNEQIVTTIQNSAQETTRATEVVSQNVHKLKEETRENALQVVEKLRQTEETTKKGFMDLTEGVDDVAKETKAGSREISAQVILGTATTSTGLQKVSSGVAMQEYLQGQYAVCESTYAIENVKRRIEERFDQAQKNVEQIQELYDDHFQRSINSFDSQLNIISSHIKQLEERTFKRLSEISFNFKLDYEQFERVVYAEQKRIEQRNQLIQSEYEKLDLKELMRFRELRNELVRFIHDASLLQLEYDAGLEGKGMSGKGFYLPMTLVQMGGGRETDMYCLDATGANCGKPLETPQNLRKLTNELRRFVAELEPTAGKEISQAEQEELYLAMKSLRSKGLIEESDYELIERHMSSHRLVRLDFQNGV